MGSARAGCRPPGPGFVLAARGADRVVLGRRRLAVAGKGRRISRSLFFPKAHPSLGRISRARPARPNPGCAAPQRQGDDPS